MSTNLGYLTGLAMRCPRGDILVHSWPNVLGCDESLRGACPGMRKSMEGVEDCASVGERYERPRLSCGNVTKDGRALFRDWYRLQLQASVAGTETLYISAVSLFFRHGQNIHSQ